MSRIKRQLEREMQFMSLEELRTVVFMASTELENRYRLEEEKKEKERKQLEEREFEMNRVHKISTKEYYEYLQFKNK